MSTLHFETLGPRTAHVHWDDDPNGGFIIIQADPVPELGDYVARLTPLRSGAPVLVRWDPENGSITVLEEANAAR